MLRVFVANHRRRRLTSPRLWGEVGSDALAHRFRVRGTLQALRLAENPPHPDCMRDRACNPTSPRTRERCLWRLFEFQKAKHHRPYCCCRPRGGPRPSLPFVPLGKRGVERRAAPGAGAPVAELPPPGTRFRGAPAPGLTDPKRRLPALHAAFSLRRRAALFVRDLANASRARGPSVSQLLAGGRNTPRRSPGAARVRRLRLPAPAGAAPVRRPGIARRRTTGAKAASPARRPDPLRQPNVSGRRPSVSEVA